jgi:hypothetical protein
MYLGSLKRGQRSVNTAGLNRKWSEVKSARNREPTASKVNVKMLSE